jgi:tetratricopeptide (TPR) repeat protein
MRAANHNGRSRSWLLAAVLLLASAGAARAADEAQVLRLRAEQFAAADRCGEALPVLQEVRRLDPGDAGAALLEGECAIRLGRYGQAIASLEDARRLDPQLSEATLYLGIAQYQTGNLELAEKNLTEAARLFPESAEAHLYRGLVLLERADTAEAAAALERASTLAPQSVDPAASFFAGQAWLAAADRERGERALRNVIEQAPDTPWAREAENTLADRRGGVQRRRGWGRVIGGIEYDTNVLLRGEGVLLLPGKGDQRDARGFWGIDGGTEIFRNADWAAGVGASYYGNAQFDLNDFDIQFPVGFAWVDRAIGDASFARVQLDAGYTWVGDDPYLLPITATLSGHHSWTEAGDGRAFFLYGRRDYRFPINDEIPAPPGVDPKKARNRDGNWFLAGYDHIVPLGKALLRGGIGVGRYDSQREYSHTAFQVWLGGRYLLPLDFAFDVYGGYTGEWYDHASTFPDPNTGFFPPARDRQDNIWRVQLELEKRITQRLSITARYRYTNDDSNTTVYAYDRNIVGGYFTVWLGEP